MNPLLLVSIAISFAATFILTKRWIPVAKRAGLVGKDMNKPDKPDVAEMGGVAVLGGILGGMLFYIGLNTFLFNNVSFNLDLFAVMGTVLIIAVVGLIDDLLGWKLGLSQLQKPLLTIPAALPMMVINAGHSSVDLPLFGAMDLGLLYPLMVVPIGIVGASNGFNIIAGYNGLEAGMGLIIISSIGFVSYLTGTSHVAMICAIAAAALVAFLIFNWHPAKIFPGNVFTYMVGSIVACTSILANVEKLALMLFMLYFLDFFLKARSRMKAEAFGEVDSKGCLKKPYSKYYAFPHVVIDLVVKLKGKASEKDVVLFILSLEGLLALIGMFFYL
ncbi:MAG: Undecaprenyl-phosphate alpha-N-acetylglucosaminyl 1-phosphate transferase [Candidatus Methanosuratincola subterraneus]|uniref:Undecaprenyl-phosphate alpha-N-acetylglucosaminyl 1-phosphate transferase n=1 Tax=Methanosuratincola subterraneus TaxID=2593994 RepID=A0A3S3TR23_METS7|nr:MAG: Undecaprenyl-phosphate alpha-N-acetylglucosaminyl 1-phosphate transferase [Candidatus Methanosuratincola subterraneus]